MDTYGCRDEDLTIAERLLAAERARLDGTHGHSVDDFESNMRQAIKMGVEATARNKK